MLLHMPSWITSARPKTPEEVAFLSGAAPAHLYLVLNREDVPETSLRARHAPALRGVTQMKDNAQTDLDRELKDLPPELRWLTWMRRIEAVLFASASPVPREDLARVLGQGASFDLFIDDLAADLEGRSFEVAKVAGGWMLRTRPSYAAPIRTAADVGEQHLDLREYDIAVMAAIAVLADPPRRAQRYLRQGDRPRPDWPPACARVDLDRAAIAAARRPLHLCDDAAIPGRV